MTGIRFISKGDNTYTDHNELANVGIYNHDIIDRFIEELEHARASELSLGQRLDNIDSHNAEQDKMLSNIDTILQQLDSVGISIKDIEQLLKEHNLKIETLQELSDTHTSSINALDSLISNIEVVLKAHISALQAELYDARLSTDGIQYNTLKDRLDAIQRATGGTATRGSEYFIEHITVTGEDQHIINLTKGSYVVGSGELDVFLNGVRQTLGASYIELSTTSISFLDCVPQGSIVTVRVHDRSNPLWVGNITTETIKLVPGTFNYNLSSPFDTTSRFLELYLNGVLLIEGKEYAKTSLSSVELLVTPNDGDYLICQIVDVNDRGIKQLVEYQKGVYECSTYTATSLEFEIGDTNLQVFVDGILLRLGVDYTLPNNKDVVFTSHIFKGGETITLCKDNNNNKAVLMSEFRKLCQEVASLDIPKQTNKEFTVSDWVKVNETDYTLTIYATEHEINRFKLIVTVYQLVGSMHLQTVCDTVINERGDVTIHAVVPFNGNIVII